MCQNNDGSNYTSSNSANNKSKTSIIRNSVIGETIFDVILSEKAVELYYTGFKDQNYAVNYCACFQPKMSCSTFSQSLKGPAFS